MEILWIFLNGICSMVWPEIAVVSWHEMGWTQSQTLLTVLVVSNFVLFISYGLVNGIFWKSSKALSVRVNDTSYQSQGVIQFLLEQYDGWENTKRKIVETIGEKITGGLNKYKHLILFAFNLIPLPVFSTITIAAARLAKIKYNIVPIFLGNVAKIYFFVWVVYTV